MLRLISYTYLTMETKVCTGCKRKLEVKEFKWLGSYKLRRSARCNTCLKKYSRRYWVSNKEIINAKRRVGVVKRRKSKYE